MPSHAQHYLRPSSNPLRKRRNQKRSQRRSQREKRQKKRRRRSRRRKRTKKRRSQRVSASPPSLSARVASQSLPNDSQRYLSSLLTPSLTPSSPLLLPFVLLFLLQKQTPDAKSNKKSKTQEEELPRVGFEYGDEIDDIQIYNHLFNTKHHTSSHVSIRQHTSSYVIIELYSIFTCMHSTRAPISIFTTGDLL